MTKHRVIAALVAGTVLGSLATTAYAGPCTSQIAEFEAAVRQSSGNPLAGLTGCISFAIIGAYIAFFHSTALVLYNFAVVAVVGVTLAVTASTGRPADADIARITGDQFRRRNMGDLLAGRRGFPTADELGAELERFLADHSKGGDQPEG